MKIDKPPPAGKRRVDSPDYRKEKGPVLAAGPLAAGCRA
jgi:hypothetical protein